jgi:DNA mismatch endonuclease (patch repair protein)
VLPRYKSVVMVHGCFWHGHDCALFRLPKTRPEFWAAKIDRNHVNDVRTIESLASSGWRVCVVWECAIRGAKGMDQDRLGLKLAHWLHGQEKMLSLSSTITGSEK